MVAGWQDPWSRYKGTNRGGNKLEAALCSLPTQYVSRIFSDHVRIVRILPISVDETDLVAECLFKEKALDDPNYDVNNVTEFACLVMQQDALACEFNQEGLFSAPDLQTVLMPEEYLILSFIIGYAKKLPKFCKVKTGRLLTKLLQRTSCQFRYCS